jgi:hypothetical protein
VTFQDPLLRFRNTAYCVFTALHLAITVRLLSVLTPKCSSFPPFNSFLCFLLHLNVTFQNLSLLAVGRWVLLDRAVGQGCWTGLLDRAVGQGCYTGLLDMSVGQGCWTGLLDRAVGQVCWTGLLDRAVG